MSLIAEESRKRMDARPDACKTCLHIDGMTEKRKAAMRDLFMKGMYSIAEVARKVGVSYSTAKKALESDDDLHAAYDTAFQANMDAVEQAMVERAIDGRNEIAAQQAGEFLLRHHRKTVYSDQAASAEAIRMLPKIVIPLTVSRSPAAPIEIESKVVEEV